MSKTILMIAFDFPPSNAASVQRTLKFFEYLNELGWTTVLLTAKPFAYPLVDNDFEIALKENQFIYRATALDVHNQLSYKGKHFSWMKTPDRWGSWIPFAIQLGKKIINKHQPDIIWSTFPTPSANVIANKLAKYCSKPWIADYRDPAPYIHTTNGKWLDKVHRKIDDITFKNAAKIIFATEASKKLYQTQYNCHDKFHVIENGYDESNFIKAKMLESDHQNIFNDKKFSLYYAGVLYPSGRDPRPIFSALSQLKKRGKISSENFELVFQGAGSGEEFKEEIKHLDITDMISFIEPTPFLLALVNMTRASALLLIQDSRFNLQIPGKIFEYFRTGKPIIIKTDKKGATAELAETHKHSYIAESTDEIKKIIVDLLTNKHDTNETDLHSHSRKNKAARLHEIILKELH